MEPKPSLSAPVGQRGILAEVRAAPPTHGPNRVLVHQQDITGSAPRASVHTLSSRPATLSQLETESEQTPTAVSVQMPMTSRRGGTMSRGNFAGKAARMDAFTWLSSVKVSEKPRDGSSSTGSGADSGNASRIGSRSRPSSRTREPNLTSTSTVTRKRSDSKTRWDEDLDGKSLQDEYVPAYSAVQLHMLTCCRITTVLTKLSSSKIRLEKVPLSNDDSIVSDHFLSTTS